MRDANPIHTLGDYSKPRHKGYKNTIELPVGNNVVPLRSNTIRLVQNGCPFRRLRSEDPKQHLKDFLKLVDSLELDGENKERTRLRLFQFSFHDQASNWLERLPAGSITTWEDLTTRFLAQFFPLKRTAKLRNDILMLQQHQGESLLEAWTRIDYATCGRLRKLRPDEAWATIEEFAQYEDEGWNDVVIPEEVSLNYKNPDIEQLLGIMEHKVDTHMKDAISLIGRSESVFWMTTNEMYQPPPKPSRQEKFEHIVMNFILDQEERVEQLKEYMNVIIGDFMKLSLEFTRRLKDKIREEGGRLRKIKKITKYPKQEVSNPRAIEVNLLPPKEYQLRKKFKCLRYSRVVCTKCSTIPLLDAAFTLGTSSIGISSPAKVLLKPSLSPSTKTLSLAPNRYDPNHLGVRFRLGGEQKEISLLELGWRIDLYSERKESTHRVTEIDLFYLYCIYSDEVVCNIPYWLAKYMVVEEDDEGDEAVGGDASHEGAGGSADMYRNMSQGDWQVRQARWMDQLYLTRRSLEDLRMFSLDDP
ncbi:zinc finger, CCHC-type containing protein [Tanacetum coccineum]